MYVRKAVWVAQTLQQLDVDVATGNMCSPPPIHYNVHVTDDGYVTCYLSPIGINFKEAFIPLLVFLLSLLTLCTTW